MSKALMQSMAKKDPWKFAVSWHCSLTTSPVSCLVGKDMNFQLPVAQPQLLHSSFRDPESVSGALVKGNLLVSGESKDIQGLQQLSYENKMGKLELLSLK